MISERDPMSQQCKCLSNSEPRWHASWCPVYQEWKAEKDRKKDEIGEAERALGETSAADMANAGARKELEGFSDAFPERDRLLAMEAEAAQRRSGETETGWRAATMSESKHTRNERFLDALVEELQTMSDTDVLGENAESLVKLGHALRDRLLAMEAEAAQRRSAVQTVVGMLVSSVNAATPFELREAARALDDTANNPATNARDRKLYRALSDVVKLAIK